MRRGLRAGAAGLLLVGACTLGGAVAGAGPAAAADGAGPVATPPSSPQTQTVSGVAANGVQLAVTVPAQLPLDLPDRRLPEREVDVTVKDVGGQGYSGQVTMTLTPEGGGASAASLRVEHFDQASGAWRSVPSSSSTFTVGDGVTVPANGTQVLKLRVSPGTTVVSDVKLNVAANGATAVAAMPVTGLAFQVSGLTGSARAGTPMVLTGTLTNPTDVGFQDVPVKLLLCSAGSSGSGSGSGSGTAGSAGCVAHASDVKVEVQGSGGAWKTVPVSDATATSPMSATVIPQLALPAGGTAQFSVRVTVGAGAFATPGQPPGQPSIPASTQPVSVAVALSPVGLSFAAQPTMSGTLTVQPPPQQPASSTPATPTSTPTSSATSTDPSPADSAAPTDNATAAPTDPRTGTAPSHEGASMPTASSSSSSPTVLVAAGLLAVCLALVLWWVLMKRRERMVRAVAGDAGRGEALGGGEDEAE